MQRITFYCLLVCGLFFAAACNTPSNGAPEANPEPMTSGGQDNTSVTPGNADGKPYTLTVMDTTVKSPRKELTGKVNGVDVVINYGSPAMNDRTIYGDLVPYGQVWRTGANEATRITFKQDVKVGSEGTMLSAGTYSLFTLPADKDDWTVIFNKTADQWGAYDYAEDADAARIKGMSANLSSPVERMDFAIEGDKVEFIWADRSVSFPVAPAAR